MDDINEKSNEERYQKLLRKFWTDKFYPKKRGEIKSAILNLCDVLVSEKLNDNNTRCVWDNSLDGIPYGAEYLLKKMGQNVCDPYYTECEGESIPCYLTKGCVNEKCVFKNNRITIEDMPFNFNIGLFVDNIQIGWLKKDCIEKEENK